MTPFLAHFKGINGGGDGRSYILQRSHLYLLRGVIAGYCPETSFGARCGCWQQSRLSSFLLLRNGFNKILMGSLPLHCAARLILVHLRTIRI